MSSLAPLRPGALESGPDSVASPDEAAAPVSVPVSAPRDHEVYDYLGPQRRWVTLTMTTAFSVAALSVLRFSMHSIWLYPFAVVLGLNVIGALISMTSGLNRRRISRESHVELLDSWRGPHPSVDVFLPTCGEDLDVLANTYRHVGSMRWGGRLRVLVLDDADRQEVRNLAEAHGFDYFVRPNRGEMKKAGNLRFGYGRSDGELIAIFDADFCPRPDYLDHLVPYFDETDVGIVQSPQCFETTTDMGWLQRTAGATQELFYRWVQPSRDRAGAPICVGTNAIYRRAALEAAGGFAQIEHSEDVHTGIALLRTGFQTRYVPLLLARGLCPDDLGAFLNQQYRWCNGSITLLNSGDAHTKPLGIRQRLCFWAGFMYYITTAINVFTIHLPGLVMAAFYPEEIRPAHYVPFLVGAWVYLVLLPRVFTTRWRFEVLRVQMAYSFSHAVAIFDKLTRRSAGWVPTGAVKTGNRLSRRIGRTAYYWLILSTASSWVFLTIDIARFGPGNFWTAVLFLGAYTYLAVPLVRDLHRLLARERTLAREALAATAPKHTAPVKTRPARPTRLAAVTRSAER